MKVTMPTWMVKTVLLVLGCGLLMTGAKMLRAVQIRRSVEAQGIDPNDGGKIYQQRLQETDRLLHDDGTLAVSWGD